MPAIGSASGAFVDALVAALGRRTRMAVIDHLAANTALLLPVGEMAAECRARGVTVLVDGAHVPGGVPLDIAALGVDYYIANLHKWAWTPRSAGIVWASPRHRHDLHPPVISWGLDRGLAAEFDFPGTRDPSPFLCTPFALAHLASYGLDAVYRHNHELVWWAAHHLAERWGTQFDTPRSMVGQLVAVRLPARLGGGPRAATVLQSRLRRDGVEVAIAGETDPTCMTMRISGQVYVDRAEIESLGDLVAGYGSDP
jgi:isopenicillin-N epimerase